MSLNPLVKGYRYGECRLLGHLWHIVPSDWTPKFGVPFTSRCERCDVERRDTLQRSSGEVLGRRYTYPDGYQFKREEGDALPRRDDFRLAWLEDEIVKNRSRLRQPVS